MLQRRFISFIFSRNHTPYPTTQGKYGIHKGVSTHTNPMEHVCGDLENAQADSTNSSLSSHNVPTSVSIIENSAVKFSAKSSLKTSPRHDFVMVFTYRLGWFGEPGSIEDYLAANGEEVKKGSIDTLNLTLEDIAGKKP
ncbi:hypothetical protein Lal_00047283 [Lupinus albus]|nr:hypothetical protein Lal_00047283 [Lupinus albus]